MSEVRSVRLGVAFRSGVLTHKATKCSSVSRIRFSSGHPPVRSDEQKHRLNRYSARLDFLAHAMYLTTLGSFL